MRTRERMRDEEGAQCNSTVIDGDARLEKANEVTFLTSVLNLGRKNKE